MLLECGYRPNSVSLRKSESVDTISKAPCNPLKAKAATSHRITVAEGASGDHIVQPPAKAEKQKARAV